MQKACNVNANTEWRGPCNDIQKKRELKWYEGDFKHEWVANHR